MFSQLAAPLFHSLCNALLPLNTLLYLRLYSGHVEPGFAHSDKVVYGSRRLQEAGGAGNEPVLPAILHLL